MSKHIETLIEELLPAALAEDLDSYQKRFDLETKLCPTMARIATIVKRPLEAEDAEQDHFAGCAHCSARIKGFRSELHPSVTKLVTTAMNLAEAADQQAVNAHFNDGCEECDRLLNTSWIKKAIAGVEAGGLNLERLLDSLINAHYRMFRVPELRLRYAEDDRRDKPFFAAMNDGDFSISLEEMDSDDLFVRITTTDPELKDRTIHLEISGERQGLEADIRLEQADQALEGVHLFPDFESAKTKLGKVLILAVAETPPV